MMVEGGVVTDTGLTRGVVDRGGAFGGAWGGGAIVLHFQMRSFLVLRSISAPFKQAGNPAF